VAVIALGGWLDRYRRSSLHLPGLPLTVVSSGGASVLGMATGVIAARGLGPVERGELAAAILWPTLFVSLGGFGLPQAVTYVAGRYRQAPAGVAGTALWLGLLQALAVPIAGFFLLPVVLWSQSDSVLAMSRFCLLSVVFFFVGGYASFLVQGLAHLRLWNVLRLIQPVCYLLGLVGLAVAGMLTAWNAVRVLVTAAAVYSVVSLVVLARVSHGTPRLDRRLARTMLLSGSQTFLAELAILLNGRADQLFITWFLLPVDLGLYAVAVGWASSLRIVSAAIAPVAFARVASSETTQEGTTYFRGAVHLGVLVHAILGACVLAVTPAAVVLLFGGEFAASAPAAMVLVAASMLFGVKYVISDGLRGLGRPMEATRAEWVGLIVTICALPVLLPRFGIVGAAIGTLLTNAASLAVIWVRARPPSAKA